jgi:flagellar protein FliL
MSQAPVVAAAGAAPADSAKGGGSNKIVLVLVALNLVAVAGVGGYVAFQLKQHPPGAAAAHGAAGEGGEAGGGHAPAERGPIVPLESIITNMADAEETHFLKVTVQLEARDEVAQLLVEGALVPIRDRVLLRLSSLTLVETQGAEKKRALQTELLAMVNDELGAHHVNHVYFTEFVVQ